MHKSLRILIVEDSETSALNIARLFQKAGYEVEHKWVETLDDFRINLEKGIWDLVISDYTLRGFTALETLRVFKKADLDIPFIVVSGTVGEDIAVEAMKVGAHDYVMKDNLERLIVDAERELRDAEHRRMRKKAEEELKKAFEMNKGIIESAPFGIYVVNSEGGVDYVNPAMLEISGDTYEQFKSMNVFCDLARYKELGLIDMVKKGLEGEKFELLDVEYVSEFGKKRTVRNFRGIPIQEKGVKKLLMFIEDITERKKGEDKIRHLNRVLRAIRGVNQLITREKDPTRLITAASRRLVETGGYGSAWIALFDENGALKMFAGEKAEKDFPEVKKMLEKGKRLKCQEMALEKGDMVEIEDPSKTCSGCPMSGEYGGRIAFCAPITREGKTYGTITVSLPENVTSSKEEQGLFRELTGDLSYAFSVMETEEEREKMQEEREKHLRELEIFYESAMGREKRILELKKEIEQLKKELGKKS